MNYHFSYVEPYHLTNDGVPVIEAKYGAKYVGPFCIQDMRGNWTHDPVDVFYQPNPDIEKGHSHYFGIFRRDGEVFICNAASAFDVPLTGLVAGNGEVVVSRWRHDFRQAKDGTVAIDGGRNYTRAMNLAAPEGDDTVCRPGMKFVQVGIEENKFIVLE